MKDIIVKGKWIKRELYILLFCLTVAFAMNIAGIAIHDTRWKELVTQLDVVVMLTFVLYLLAWVIRLLVYAIVIPVKKIIKKK